MNDRCPSTAKNKIKKNKTTTLTLFLFIGIDCCFENYST